MLSPLFSNAVSAIQLGIEDYQSSDPKRNLSAVRNIAAGILLVFKEKLRLLSPDDSDEVLLKERVLPTRIDGRLCFVGRGRKTVDLQQIKDRFESLGVNADWKRFDDLIKVRNDLEHYYSSASAIRVREVLSDAFLVLRSFITSELHLEPVALLGEQAWNALLSEAAVYDEELSRCHASIDQINWPTTEHSDWDSPNITDTQLSSRSVFQTLPDSIH